MFTETSYMFAHRFGCSLTDGEPNWALHQEARIAYQKIASKEDPITRAGWIAYHGIEELRSTGNLALNVSFDGDISNPYGFAAYILRNSSVYCTKKSAPSPDSKPTMAAVPMPPAPLSDQSFLHRFSMVSKMYVSVFLPSVTAVHWAPFSVDEFQKNIEFIRKKVSFSLSSSGRERHSYFGTNTVPSAVLGVNVSMSQRILLFVLSAI